MLGLSRREELIMSAKIFFYVISFLCLFSSDAKTTIIGNSPTRDGNSFSFSIKQSYVTSDQRMVVAAAQAGAQDYSLCALESGSAAFRPLAAKHVIHNGQKDQENPLFDAAIAAIAPLNNTNVVAVKVDDLTRVYCQHFGLAKSYLFSTAPLTDASGTHVTSGITALAAGNGYAFVAVKGHDQERFGTGNSGIALVKFSEITTYQEMDQKALDKLKEDGKDLSEEEKQEIRNALTVDKEGKTKKKITTFGFAHINTAPLNNNNNVLKAGDAEVAIEEITDMYYSPALERVYVACKMSGSGQKCAIAVGYIDGDGKLQLAPVMSSFAPFGGLDADYSPLIYKVRTLQTSTGYLDYLIVLADAWPCDKRKQVYALPLVNLKQLDGTITPEKLKLQGTVVHKQSSLVEGYGECDKKTGRSLFLGRHFNQSPISVRDLPSNFDSETHVGGFYSAAFEDMNVQGDCVYAIVNESKDDELSSELKKGVYQSHAVFAYDGRIISWTRWKRVGDFPKHIASYTIDGAQGGAIVTEGADAYEIRSVSRTGWSDQQNDLIEAVSKEFPKENGGIQGLFDFHGDESSSLLYITGKAKLMLVPIYSNNAAEAKRPVLIVDGINEIGSIIAVEHQDIYPGVPWIGGSGGLAVLDYKNSTQDKAVFKKIGNFSFVKKLIAERHYLYVLTDTTLDRIDIKQSDFENNKLAVTRLAHADDLLAERNSYFYDCIVSGPLALIAHTKGLSRIANDHDVRTDTMQTIAWTDVPLTPKPQPCIALSAVNIIQYPLNLPGYYNAGQIYAVCGSKQARNSKVYRLAVIQTDSVTDATVMPLNDYIGKDLPPYYFNLRSYTPGFFTDGTLSFVTHNKKDKVSPAINTHYGTLQSTRPIKINDASTITHMVRCSATGKWIVAGDFGLVINE